VSAQKVASSGIYVSRQGKIVNLLNTISCAQGGFDPKDLAEISTISSNGYGDVDWRWAMNAVYQGYIARQLTKMTNELGANLKKTSPRDIASQMNANLKKLLDTGETYESDPAKIWLHDVPTVKWGSYILGIADGEDGGLLGGGYRNGQIIVYVAPSGHGKSSMCTAHAIDCALSHKYVSFISTELPPEKVLQRLMMTATGLPESVLVSRQGRTTEEHKFMMEWLDFISKFIRIYDGSFFPAPQVERILANDKPDALIIDYMQLFPDMMGRVKSADPIGDYSRSMFAWYGRYKLPIITCAQMSASNAKAFLEGKRDVAPIPYGNSTPLHVASNYFGMMRSAYKPNHALFRTYKDSNRGIVGGEVELPFNPPNHSLVMGQKCLGGVAL
jgi:replicative DNA helicase